MGIIAEQWQTGEGVQLDVQRATGLRRLTGLIRRPPLAPNTALRITRCRSVHGFAIGRAIDVVFFDRSGRVVRSCTLRPWRVAWAPRARQVFELAAGEAARLGLTLGTQIRKSTDQKGSGR